jgi:hypothetical protein
MTGALHVGYRRPALAKAGLPSVLLAFGTAYTGHLASGGEAVATVAFAGCALATLLIVPLYLRAVVRAVRGAPLLTLDRAGVTLHSARITLPWPELAEIRIQHGAAGDLLVFVPLDAARVLAGLRGLRRRFARDGMSRVGGPIFVRAAQLASPVEEILAAARHWSAAPVRHRHALGPVGGPR